MKNIYPNRQTKGFTLLEVLIGLLVLSIGLLGLAGLQALSLKTSHAAYLGSQAVALTYDMSDRIRANPNGNYGGQTPSCPDTVSATPVLQNDLDEWACLLTTLLPAGEGSIIDQGNNRFLIRVSWNDPQSDEAGSEQQIRELEVRL